VQTVLSSPRLAFPQQQLPQTPQPAWGGSCHPRSCCHYTARQGKLFGLLVFHRFRFRAILQPDNLRRGMNYLAGSVLLQRSGAFAMPRKTKPPTPRIAAACIVPAWARLPPRAGRAGCWQQICSPVETTPLGFDSVSNYSLPTMCYHSSTSHAESFTLIPNWMKSPSSDYRKREGLGDKEWREDKETARISGNLQAEMEIRLTGRKYSSLNPVQKEPCGHRARARHQV